MPTVQIACMEDCFPFSSNHKRITRIGRAESIDTDVFVFKVLAFLEVNSIIFTSKLLLQNIFREQIDDVRPLRLPFQHFGIEMVGMKMRSQDIELFFPFQQFVVYESFPFRLVCVLIVIDNYGITISFDYKTAMEKIGQFHVIVQRKNSCLAELPKHNNCLRRLLL